MVHEQQQRDFKICSWLEWKSNNATHLRIYALMQFELKTLNHLQTEREKSSTLVTYDLLQASA